MVYRNRENYLGLGINASSCISWTRRKNTPHRKAYLWSERKDTESENILSKKEILSEEVMLSLRTDRGVLLENYADVLVSNSDEVVKDLLSNGYASYDKETSHLLLTSRGLDIYNTILLTLLKDL